MVDAEGGYEAAAMTFCIRVGPLGADWVGANGILAKTIYEPTVGKAPVVMEMAYAN